MFENCGNSFAAEQFADIKLESKGQTAVHACMIRLLNLGPAEHEEVAIYVVNQRIPNVRELRELLCSGAIRGYRVRVKSPFAPNILIKV